MLKHNLTSPLVSSPTRPLYNVVMPILGEEPNLYPDALLDQASSDATDRRWFALYTKARQEKSLARELLKYRVPFYLPLVKKTSISRGRRRTSRRRCSPDMSSSMGRKKTACGAWPPTGFPECFRWQTPINSFSICGSFAN